jgi:hypothetical protein
MINFSLAKQVAAVGTDYHMLSLPAKVKTIPSLVRFIYSHHMDKNLIGA